MINQLVKLSFNKLRLSWTGLRSRPMVCPCQVWTWLKNRTQESGNGVMSTDGQTDNLIPVYQPFEPLLRFRKKKLPLQSTSGALLYQASHESEQLVKSCFTQATHVFTWKHIWNYFIEVDELHPIISYPKEKCYDSGSYSGCVVW